MRFKTKGKRNTKHNIVYQGAKDGTVSVYGIGAQPLYAASFGFLNGITEFQPSEEECKQVIDKADTIIKEAENKQQEILALYNNDGCDEAGNKIATIEKGESEDTITINNPDGTTTTAKIGNCDDIGGKISTIEEFGKYDDPDKSDKYEFYGDSVNHCFKGYKETNEDNCETTSANEAVMLGLNLRGGIKIGNIRPSKYWKDYNKTYDKSSHTIQQSGTKYKISTIDTPEVKSAAVYNKHVPV